MSRHEKRVSALLAEHNIQTFLPLYRTIRQWKKSRPATVDVPLYPGYVFARITREARGSILRTPGVLSLVGSPREAWPLPQQEIEILRLGLHERRVQPHPYVAIGDRVRIVSGTLRGMEGVLLRRKNRIRVVISLDLIMQSISVEVDSNEVAPVMVHNTPEICRA